MTAATKSRRVTPSCELVLPADAPREEWLAARRTGIGSSDASAVVGLNAYASPLSVWLDKLDGNPLSDEDSEVMEFGRELEPVVANVFARRTGKQLKRVGLVRSLEWPWMTASCDRIVIGEPAVVECKTTAWYRGQEWADDEIPDHAVIQATHQLAVTGLERAYIPVLIGGNHLEHRVLERDEAAIARLVEVTGEFWHTNVQKRIEPTAVASDIRLLKERFTPDPDKTILLSQDALELIRERADVRKHITAAEKHYKALTARIAQIMGDATAATTGDGEPVLTYIPSQRTGYTVAAKEIRTLSLTRHGKALING